MPPDDKRTGHRDESQRVVRNRVRGGKPHHRNKKDQRKEFRSRGENEIGRRNGQTPHTQRKNYNDEGEILSGESKSAGREARAR